MNNVDNNVNVNAVDENAVEKKSLVETMKEKKQMLTDSVKEKWDALSPEQQERTKVAATALVAVGTGLLGLFTGLSLRD